MVKKKVKRNKSQSESNEKVDECVPVTLPADHEQWVHLDLRLLNWDYLNFKLHVRTSTKLFAIKNKMIERHGRIMDLKLCKERFCQNNEMTDDMKTLEEYDIVGGLKDDSTAVCLLYYDFKPCGHDDPLLLNT